MNIDFRSQYPGILFANSAGTELSGLQVFWLPGSLLTNLPISTSVLIQALHVLNSGLLVFVPGYSCGYSAGFSPDFPKSQPRYTKTVMNSQ